jgi:hypothetical protein
MTRQLRSGLDLYFRLNSLGQLQSGQAIPHGCQQGRNLAIHGDELLVQVDQYAAYILLGVSPENVCVPLGTFKDRGGPLFGMTDQLVILDDFIGIFTGQSQEALTFLLGLGQDPIPFLLDLLCLFDLLGDRRPHLVNHIQKIVLVDHKVRAQGHPPALVQQSFQAIDQVVNVAQGNFPPFLLI